jgi:ankyrin repeat protein
MKMTQNNFGEQIGGIIDLFIGKSSLSPAQEKAAELEFDRLTIAAQAGDTELFKQLLIAERADLERCKDSPTLLMGAVMAKREAIVRALLEAGADVNATYEQFFIFDALGFAVDNGSTEIVRLLLAAGADPNRHNSSPGMTPILKACEKGHADIVRLLLEAGAAVKFGTGFRLLTEAAQKSTPEIVQTLIDAGCNVNTRDRDTPLTAACRLARVEIVQTLLANAANPNKPGMHDMMPLTTIFLAPQMLAAIDDSGLDIAVAPERQAGDLSERIDRIVSLLLAAGADPNTHDVMGKTPLMLALEQHNLVTAERLLAAGADVNKSTQPKADSVFLHGKEIVTQSALHLAIADRHHTAIDFLLAAGADPQLANSEDITAQELAKSILGRVI